jgi:hypothetical protein
LYDKAKKEICGKKVKHESELSSNPNSTRPRKKNMNFEA